MVAKSLDVVMLLKLAIAGERVIYSELARDLHISASEAHASVRRLIAAQLLDPKTRLPRLEATLEYILHGVKYAFPARRGPVTRGIATSFAALQLPEKNSTEELPPVWRDPEGMVRGYELEPLYRSVPKAVKKDRELYELLALVDALRDGAAHEQRRAQDELAKRLKIALLASR